MRKSPADPLENIEINWDDLIPEITPDLEAASLDAAESFMLRIGLNDQKDAALWKKVLDQARKIARERAAELVGRRVLPDGRIVDNPNAEWAITETTRAALRELSSQAIDEGWTVSQLQHQILEHETFSPARALNIARTETAYARSHGNHEAAKGVGMKYKSWIPHSDCCDVCQANADQGRIAIDEPFDSGDDCVPAHPSDMCANGYYESADGD